MTYAPKKRSSRLCSGADGTHDTTVWPVSPAGLGTKTHSSHGPGT